VDRRGAIRAAAFDKIVKDFTSYWVPLGLSSAQRAAGASKGSRGEPGSM
jgi:hypothetical protein